MTTRPRRVTIVWLIVTRICEPCRCITVGGPKNEYTPTLALHGQLQLAVQECPGHRRPDQ